MKLAHIVACANDSVIGHAGGMPWHVPEDLRLFRKITLGHIVIMGRKTFTSLGKPLAKRLNIVVTRQQLPLGEGVLQASSLEAAIEMAQSHAASWGQQAFIIGGGEIYAQTMGQVDRIYLSEIALTVTGDTHFPSIDPEQFHLIHEESMEAPIPFSFKIFERRSLALAESAIH